MRSADSATQLRRSAWETLWRWLLSEPPAIPAHDEQMPDPEVKTEPGEGVRDASAHAT
jgi:hypothetical protein